MKVRHWQDKEETLGLRWGCLNKGPENTEHINFPEISRSVEVPPHSHFPKETDFSLPRGYAVALSESRCCIRWCLHLPVLIVPGSVFIVWVGKYSLSSRRNSLNTKKLKELVNICQQGPRENTWGRILRRLKEEGRFLGWKKKNFLTLGYSPVLQTSTFQQECLDESQYYIGVFPQMYVISIAWAYASHIPLTLSYLCYQIK